MERLGAAVEVSLADAHNALKAVAAVEQDGALSPGGKPLRSRCALNNCRRHHLAKALSVPAPAAPALIAHTLTSITLRVCGCVVPVWGAVREDHLRCPACVLYTYYCRRQLVDCNHPAHGLQQHVN